MFIVFRLVALAACLSIVACAPAPTVRGVSSTGWHQLSASQRQLIIDQSYQQQVVDPGDHKAVGESYS
jgi:hypothetical protein